MRLRAITCPNCGAPIEAPIDADVVTCSFCGSETSLQRADMEGVAAQLHEVENDNALIRLDQDWDAQSEQYMIRTKDGDLQEPRPFSPGRVIGLLVVAAILAAILLFSPVAIAGRVTVACLSFILILLGSAVSLVWKAKGSNERYRAYREAEDAYQAQRDALVKERMQR